MESASPTRVASCQLCQKESCCPEHCCDWDTCQCRDCYQCSANKLDKEYAVLNFTTDLKYEDPTNVVNVNSPTKHTHHSIVHPPDHHD